MPKVTLIKDPPVDILLAVCLERKQVKNLSFEALGKKTGLSAGHLTRLFKSSPWDWEPDTRRKICRALDVPQQYITANAR